MKKHNVFVIAEKKCKTNFSEGDIWINRNYNTEYRVIDKMTGEFYVAITLQSKANSEMVNHQYDLNGFLNAFHPEEFDIDEEMINLTDKVMETVTNGLRRYLTESFVNDIINDMDATIADEIETSMTRAADSLEATVINEVKVDEHKIIDEKFIKELYAHIDGNLSTIDYNGAIQVLKYVAMKTGNMSALSGKDI